MLPVHLLVAILGGTTFVGAGKRADDLSKFAMAARARRSPHSPCCLLHHAVVPTRASVAPKALLAQREGNTLPSRPEMPKQPLLRLLLAAADQPAALMSEPAPEPVAERSTSGSGEKPELPAWLPTAALAGDVVVRLDPTHVSEPGASGGGLGRAHRDQPAKCFAFCCLVLQGTFQPF